MFRYMCKRTGKQCSYATEYGYCKVTVCMEVKPKTEYQSMILTSLLRELRKTD